MDGSGQQLEVALGVDSFHAANAALHTSNISVVLC